MLQASLHMASEVIRRTEQEYRVWRMIVLVLCRGLSACVLCVVCVCVCVCVCDLQYLGWPVLYKVQCL